MQQIQKIVHKSVGQNVQFTLKMGQFTHYVIADFSCIEFLVRNKAMYNNDPNIWDIGHDSKI